MVRKNANVSIPEIKEHFPVEGGLNDYLYFRFSHDTIANTNFPLRIDGFAAGICICGWMEISIGLHRIRLAENDFMIILPCYTIQVHEVSIDFDFEIVMISSDFMDAIHINTDKVVNPFIYVEEKPVVKIDNEEGKELILTMYESLHNLSKFSELPYYREMIQHYVYAFIFGIGYIYEQFAPGKNGSFSGKNSLLKRFFSLLQKHFKKEHSVAFYAGQLYLSSKYLSAQIKKESGRTAKEWIQEMIVLEAKVLLHNHKMSIQQVADKLHFSDQKAFGKFFKKHTGLTPKEYK